MGVYNGSSAVNDQDLAAAVKGRTKSCETSAVLHR